MDEARNIKPRELSAGPFRLLFDQGDLRYVKIGQHEVLRRVYVAVRDRNWNTIPATISQLSVQSGEDTFAIGYDAVHVAGEIDFAWRAEITGESDGKIRFTFDGVARSSFLRNRIGFCVLHPAELAGVSCEVDYANGSGYATSFPRLVAAEQPVRAIHDLTAIRHEVAPGWWAEVSFQGDLFEMEDQRNWIDASFKTYCTPLRLPFPLRIEAGRRIRQTIELRLLERGASRRPVATVADPGSVALIQTGATMTIPPIGLGGSNCQLSPREVDRLKGLRPAHLRVDLIPGVEGVAQTLADAGQQARQLGVPLEVALLLGDNAEAELDLVRDLIGRAEVRVARWLIFDRHARSSSAQSLRLARQSLGSLGAPVGGGTNADFYQLNQFRPPSEWMDFVAFSMNPQTHACDDTSLVETLTVIPDPVESARHYFGDLPVVISPLTLRPRFNPVATGAEGAPDPDQLPASVDPRQMTLFGAAWTLGAVKRLAESQPASITLFETTGWRGVTETESGSSLPGRFPSIPGGVFPLYHVLADLAEFAGGEVVELQSSIPLRVEALLLRDGERQTLLVANLTSDSQSVEAAWLSGTASLRRLRQENLELAVRQPEAFRTQSWQHELSVPRMVLSAYEIVRLDRRAP
jgi:hypothetical protein